MRSRTRAASVRPPRKRRQIPYWLLAAILLALLAIWSIVVNGDYAVIFRALRQGVLVTLWVSVVSFLLAVVLGLAIALARVSRFRLLREAATFYIEIVRGIPVLVLLFYIAFVGAPQLVLLWNWFFEPLIAPGWLPAANVRDFDMAWRAVAALAISYAAFVAEIFRAGIESVPRGQVEAARSLGLRPYRIYRHVILPQALRNAVPPLGNDLVALIKDSALVSALGVQDITQLGKVYSSSTFLFFETYNVVAFLYLVMTVGLSLIVRGLESRLKKSGRH